ncbi:MAG: A1S_2505 family phage non-structural protein [Candidatus Micrarchaeaceae archaeon]
MTIFVFGSNLAGKHYGGAAKYALEKFDAEMGIGEGLTGNSYALPTMDSTFSRLPLAAVDFGVHRFKRYATNNPHLAFYVTRIGCGISGFTDEQIAPMFAGSPSNCTFDPQWSSFGLPAWKEVL